MARKVADQFVDLHAAGVKRIYGIVEDTLNGITDALRRQGKTAGIHVRHEAAGAFAAAGEAHVADELAVCARSCGPGDLHLVNGLFDAYRSRVLVLGIAAHLPSAEIGSGYFQESHPQDLFKECGRFCELIPSANQMPRILESAIHSAESKRGVAVVVIPADIVLQPALNEPLLRVAGLLPAQLVAAPAAADIERLAGLLNGDARVTLLCGSGCQGAHAQLLALAERLQALIVDASKGKEHVEWDNPYGVGMSGLIGFSSGYDAMLDCDVLVMVGTDFPYRQFYPHNEGVRIAKIDHRGEIVRRRAAVGAGILGDIRASRGDRICLSFQQSVRRRLSRLWQVFVAVRMSCRSIWWQSFSPPRSTRWHLILTLPGLDPGCCRAASHACFPVPGEGLVAFPMMPLDMIVSYTVSATALLAKGQTNAYRTVRSLFHRCLFSRSRNCDLGAAGALRP